MTPAEELIYLLETGKILVGGSEAERDIQKWQAFRSSKKDWIAGYVGWSADRKYKVDPLPKRISKAFGDFLYGKDPLIEAASPEDNANLWSIVNGNKLPSAWRRRADQCTAEGEIWWRLHLDRAVKDVPIITWWSRRDVRPLFYGDDLVAAAVIIDYGCNDIGRWRLVEVHEDGAVYNRLYCLPKGSEYVDYEGSYDDPANIYCKLGENRPLEAHPLTAGLSPEFDHRLPGMLVGRIANELEDDCDVGVSVYQGIEDLLLDLNEAHCIDAENFRLAGKKRAVMPRKYATSRSSDGAAVVDTSEEILFTEGDGDEMDGGDDQFKILEYQYDGASSIARKEDLTNTALTRVGLARQLVDPNNSEGGGSASGIALRTRLIPTIATVNGMGREWDDNNPVMLQKAMALDAMDEGRGGFGRTYVNLGELPSVQRFDPLPEDISEVDNRHTALVGAGLESIEEAINELHPDWEEERVVLEVERILANRDNAGITKEGNIIQSPISIDPLTGAAKPDPAKIAADAAAKLAANGPAIDPLRTANAKAIATSLPA